MTQGEMRQNKATKEWVIFAPARGKRPHDFKRAKKQREDLPAFDKECPFCPGNEHMLTNIVFEMADQGNKAWQTRIVPNKFPAVTPDGNSSRSHTGLYVAMRGTGRHEVIIESAQHNHQVALMSPGQVETVIETYHRRYIDLMHEDENMMIIIFRNHAPAHP